MRTFFLATFILSINCLFAQNDYKKLLNLDYADLDSLVMIPYSKGDYHACIQYMQAGREKAKEEFGQQDSTYAYYTSNLSFFYDLVSQYGKALDLCIEAKQIREKVLGINHPEYSASLINLASLYQVRDDYDKALPLLIQSVEIYRKSKTVEKSYLGTALINLASLYQSMGEFSKAESLYKEAKDIQEEVYGVEGRLYVNVLNNLADLYYDMGDYDKALSLQTQVKRTYKKILGEEHPLYATSLNNLGILYHQIKKYNKALDLFKESKEIRINILGRDHLDIVTSLDNIASVYVSMKALDKAQALYLESQAIIVKLLGKNNFQYAISLNNIATVHREQENYEKAIALYKEVIKIRGRKQGNKHPEYNAVLINLASAYLKMNRLDDAKITLKEVLKNISSEELDISSSWTEKLSKVTYPSKKHLNLMFNVQEQLYSLLQEDNSISDSKEKQKRVAELCIKLLKQLEQKTTENKDKLRLFDMSNTWIGRSLNLLNPESESAQAFLLASQNKSVLLHRETRSESSYSLGNLPDSLIWLDKKLKKKHDFLQVQLLEQQSRDFKDSLLNELNQVTLKKDDFAKMLKQKYPKYHQLKFKDVEFNVKDIQDLLPENTALIEYVVTDSVIHIFMVDKNGILWEKSSIEMNDLKKNIKTLHQSLSDYTLITTDLGFYNYVEKAHWFYKHLISPVLSERKDLANLIIVPDRELGHLPFEAFLIDEVSTQKAYKELNYLIKSYTISYSNSSLLWKESQLRESNRNNGQMFAVAADYNLNLERSTNRQSSALRKNLMPLPEAKKEVEYLQQRYKGYFSFDSLASERLLKSKVSDYAILHFATHGLLNARKPMFSSLVLTAVADSIEDNILQAYEVSKLSINADLVVLSACETGFGKFETGNGIASLARSFMYAGASSLVVSLWQVNDYATAEIMKNFYANLEKGIKKDQALRQAKILYMESAEGQLAHPAYWSPFVLMGNTEAISLETNTAFDWTSSLLILFLALMIVVYFIWKRSRVESKD